MIKAVLWDNDGILLDTEKLFYEITRDSLFAIGLDLTEDFWAEEYLGKGRRTGDIALSLGGKAEDIIPAVDKRNRLYVESLDRDHPVRPMVRETLNALEGKVKMALVTGSFYEMLYTMHRNSGLLRYFKTIVTQDDYRNSKPHPEPYLTAMNIMNLSPDECIAVEDSVRGFMSAKNAGIGCVVVPTELTCRQEFPGALSVEKDVSGILKYIDAL